MRPSILRSIKELPCSNKLETYYQFKRCSTLYSSLISTLFDHADNIWGDKFNATLMDDLHVLQNKTKIILNLPFFSSSTHAVEALGWQTSTKRRLLHRYVLIYEHVNGLINFDLNLLRNFNIHSYNTRKMNNLRFPRVQRNYGE